MSGREYKLGSQLHLLLVVARKKKLDKMGISNNSFRNLFSRIKTNQL